MRGRQLSLFSAGEVAALRDRTRSRNYCPERDEVRRAHERHRAWGKARRHAERLRQLQDRPRHSRPAGTGQHPPRRAPLTPASESIGGERPARPAPGRHPGTSQEPTQSRRSQNGRTSCASAPQSQPAPVAQATADRLPMPVAQPTADEQATADRRPKPTTQPTPDKPTTPDRHPKPTGQHVAGDHRDPATPTAAPGSCRSMPTRRPSGTTLRHSARNRQAPITPSGTTLRHNARNRQAPVTPSCHRRTPAPIEAGLHFPAEISSITSPRRRECDTIISKCGARSRSPPTRRAPIDAQPRTPMRGTLHGRSR